MSPIRPTVGRVVHYHVGQASAPRAALIVGVYEDEPTLVDLAVFERPGRPLAGMVAPITAEVGVSYGTSWGEWSWPVLLV